jgi:hypothetical protein
MLNQIQNLKPIAIAIALFLILSIAYMSPALSGKNISQHDVEQFKGMSKELVDYRESTGKEAIWTNSMFGGMPGYLISVTYPNNLLVFFQRVITLNNWRPFSFIFLYLLGFYAALLAFKVNKYLAIVGAIAYAFSSYLIIIIVAGHASKAMALGYLPAIIGGVHLAFRGKYLHGAVLLALALGLQLKVSHLQITYYTLIIILIYGVFELIQAVKDKQLVPFSKALGMLIIGVILAVASNITNLITTAEYGKYSMRGKSDLTSEAENKTSGLDKDYATDWSYGKAESFTLLIPNFMGGASGGELPQDSETFAFLSKVQGKANAKKSIKQMPTYWGGVSYTAGPVYVGAIICFLFILGLFIVDKKLRWWILTATIVSLILAWGKNVPDITNFLLDHLPGYNKFRAVSMTLVIAGFTIPLLAILAFDSLLKKNIDKKKALSALKYSFGITAGLILFFILFAKNLFSFEALSDQQYLAQGYNEFVDALQSDRAMLLRQDAFRSLIFITLAAGIVLFLIKEKLKSVHAIALLGILVLVDMWAVDKRYLNESNFVSNKKYDTPFTPSKADQLILQDNDPDYRVLNIAVSTFNDASTSYFHKSIGGYHGAKMRRYQELIEHNISPEIQKTISALQSGDFNQVDHALASDHVLNMLNTKYIIFNPEAQPLVNNSRLGNAWFVSDYKMAENADEEIAELGKLNTKTSAVIDKQFSEFVLNKQFIPDSLATITLDEYQPNNLKYSTNANSDQLAIFSEIYYPKGWEVSIDGKPAEHFRANYVLRAMVIPAGEHLVEFSFKPKSYYLGEKISLASSLIFILLLIGVVGWEAKKYFSQKE